MLNEIRKLAYCQSCGKNVPHSRRVSGALDGLLQLLRIGPWICLHCKRKQMILPAVRRYAADFLAVAPDDSNDVNKPEIWSSTCPTEAEAMQSREWDYAGDFDDEREQLNSFDESFIDGGEKLNCSLDADRPRENYMAQDQREIQIKSKASVVADEQPDHVDVGSEHSSLVLEEADRKNLSEPDFRSESGDNFESEEIPEAEPVGNFIKDQSLVLQSARLDRFSEKFRDSVVDRILSGKVSISSLTSDGDYSESELVSWIADKAKRQDERVETLELDVDPR